MNARNASLSRRDAGYPAPPAQSRPCSFPASGFSVALLRFGRKSLLAIIVAIAGLLGAAPQGICAVVEPELLATVPPTNGMTPELVEGIQVLDRDPNQIVFTTQNVGAGCGGGTPAAVWKLVLDPGTLLPESLELKQILSEIQQARGSLFESQDGKLYTGGGWCGPKPPYVSIDAGETWRPANIGGDPPNSTFSFTEFMDNVYAGTGYEPYHGQVYRWIGDSTKDWNLIFDIPPPRTIVTGMTT